MIIRDENASDYKNISYVTEEAFKTLEISDNREHLIIDELRKTGALSISLVAEENGNILGHIAFSPVEISDGSEDWYALGPVSVLPEYHGKGIGSSLIKEGLNRLRRIGAKGCVLVGEPGFYNRFGFYKDEQLKCEGIPEKYFLVLSFTEISPSGYVTYNKAFYEGN